MPVELNSGAPGSPVYTECLPDNKGNTEKSRAKGECDSVLMASLRTEISTMP